MIPVALASGSAAAYGLSDYLGGVQARRARNPDRTGEVGPLAGGSVRIDVEAPPVPW